MLIDSGTLITRDKVLIENSKQDNKAPKKMFACPHPTDRLVRPDCKSFFLLFFSLKFKTVSSENTAEIASKVLRTFVSATESSVSSLQDRIHHSLIFMNIISGVGNTVAKMADAMDTRDACRLAIRSKTLPEISH